MDFNYFFCMLVDMTDSSIAEIARTISYDRSYVSKWYNDKALPSISAWDDISPKLAALFSEKLRKEHYEKIAQKVPRVKTERASLSDQELLKSLLDDAFKTSYLQTYQKEDSLAASNISIMINGFEEFMAFVVDIIDKGLTNEEITKNIYFQYDLFDFLTSEIIDSMVFPYTSNNNYRLHFTVNSRFLNNYGNELIKKLHNFFRLTSQLPFMELIPYKSDDLKEFQCAFDETYYSYGANISSGNNFKIFITKNPNIYEKGRRKLKKFFSELFQLITVEPSTENFLYWLNQEHQGQVENSGIFFLPVLPLYWGGWDLREKLYTENLISQADYDVWQVGLDLSIQEKIQKSTFLITESGINRVMHKGQVKTCEGFLQLNAEDRSTYIAEIQILLEEKKAKDELYVIPNDMANINRLPTNVIYSDGITAFYLQNNQVNAYKTGRLFYKINDITLADFVYRYLTELHFIETNDFVL
ncbi:MAG: hypothetical protein GX328_06655 [Clostridiaceae bacterium]|nr:hypothetical protein [Clostridiaceae bacterium]